MNCKPGELAFVINARHDPKLIGLIVSIVELWPVGKILFDGYTGPQYCNEADAWLVRAGSRQWLHGDKRLRPIRPGDLSDNTPTEAMKPEVIEA